MAWMSLSEVAKELRVSRRRVWQWAINQTHSDTTGVILPAKRAPGSTDFFVSTDDLDSFKEKYKLEIEARQKTKQK